MNTEPRKQQNWSTSLNPALVPFSSLSTPATDVHVACKNVFFCHIHFLFPPLPPPASQGISCFARQELSTQMNENRGQNEDGDNLLGTKLPKLALVNYSRPRGLDRCRCTWSNVVAFTHLISLSYHIICIPLTNFMLEKTSFYVMKLMIHEWYISKIASVSRARPFHSWRHFVPYGAPHLSRNVMFGTVFKLLHKQSLRSNAPASQWTKVTKKPDIFFRNVTIRDTVCA